MCPSLKISKDRIQTVLKLLEDCTLCPRKCHVNRLRNEKGYCGQNRDIKVSSYTLHFGEEPELVGSGGSGTIFLTGCNLGCIFCQNYDISHLHCGDKVKRKDFVQMMLTLQRLGAHNINFITPTHFTPQILESIFLAREKGLKLPIVYNCSGYEQVETLKSLEGAVDIYMPDAKFADAKVAKELCQAQDYYPILKEALKEMHRQVGDLFVDEHGIARRGLLIRHLVLPDGLAGSEKILSFIAQEISADSYVNIMQQYRPNPYTRHHARLGRNITLAEYNQVIMTARRLGLHKGF